MQRLIPEVDTINFLGISGDPIVDDIDLDDWDVP